VAKPKAKRTSPVVAPAPIEAPAEPAALADTAPQTSPDRAVRSEQVVEERAEVVPGAVIDQRRCRRASTSLQGVLGHARLPHRRRGLSLHQNHRYRISTIGEARGSAALVLRGQGKLSRGLITDEGLQPLLLRIERGGPDRVETAVFDWEAGIVTMHDNKTAPLDLPTFDPLALGQYYFTPPAADHVTVTVATPRRLIRYDHARGDRDHRVARPHRSRARHRRSDDGKTDAYIWLAPSLRHIPVKIRVSNTERGTLEVLLDTIRVDEDAARSGRDSSIPREVDRPPRQTRRSRRRDPPKPSGDDRSMTVRATARRAGSGDRQCAGSQRRQTTDCRRSSARIAKPVRATARSSPTACSRFCRMRSLRNARRVDRSATTGTRVVVRELGRSLRDLAPAIMAADDVWLRAFKSRLHRPLPRPSRTTSPIGCGNVWALPTTSPPDRRSRTRG
jgi:hypothetical protein